MKSNWNEMEFVLQVSIYRLESAKRMFFLYFIESIFFGRSIMRMGMGKLVLFWNSSLKHRWIQAKMLTRNNRKEKSDSSAGSEKIINECTLNPENLKVSIKKVKVRREKKIMIKFPLNKYLDRVRNKIPIDFLNKCAAECKPKSGVKYYISRSLIAYSAWKYIEHLNDRIAVYEECK